MKKRLSVVYDGPPNSDVDSVIKEAIEQLGYFLWASGYDFYKNKRDLAFECS